MLFFFKSAFFGQNVFFFLSLAEMCSKILHIHVQIVYYKINCHDFEKIDFFSDKISFFLKNINLKHLLISNQSKAVYPTTKVLTLQKYFCNIYIYFIFVYTLDTKYPVST